MVDRSFLALMAFLPRLSFEMFVISILANDLASVRQLFTDHWQDRFQADVYRQLR